MTSAWAVLLALGAAQEAAPKPQDRKVLEELWRPRADRVFLPSLGRTVLVVVNADPLTLPNRAVVRVEPIVIPLPRRSPGDLPEEFETLLLEAASAGSTTTAENAFVENTRWRLESSRASEPVLPLIHRINFTFDPRQGQLEELREQLARARPIVKTALVLPGNAKFDPAAAAAEIGKIAAVLLEFKALLEPVAVPADALPVGVTDRMTRAQMPPDVDAREEKRGRLTPADARRIYAAMNKLSLPLWLAQGSSPFWQTGRALGTAHTHTSGALSLMERDVPAHSFLARSLFGRSAENALMARKRFGVELYLYERTLLADLTDQTWIAYRRHQAGDRKIWEDWRKIFPVHFEMLRLCNDAMVNLEDAELKASYVALTGGIILIPPPPDPQKKPEEKPKDPVDPKGLPFLKVQAFYAACEAKITGEGKEDPEKLQGEVAGGLPAPRK